MSSSERAPAASSGYRHCYVSQDFTCFRILENSPGRGSKQHEQACTRENVSVITLTTASDIFIGLQAICAVNSH